VFPLARRTKRPLTETGFQEATTDIATVEAWWKGNPEANIGFPPGKAGFVVFDIDGQAGEKAAEALGLLSEPTLECVSHRGRHLYFGRPECLPYVGNLKLAPDLDVRCDAGYVVIGPSVHPDGHQYRWKGKLEDIKALPPKALEALVAQATAPRSDIAERIERQEVWPEGERHTRLVQAAGRLVSKGHSPEEVLALVDGLNATNCAPRLEESEVAKIVADIQDTDRKRHPERYRERSVLGEEGLLAPPNSLNPPPSWPAPIDNAAFHGLLEHVAVQLDPSTEADPVAILAHVLVVAGSIIGRGPRFMVGGTAHRVNENILLVGATASGRKGMAKDAALATLRGAWDADWREPVSGLSSGEGLIHAVRDPVHRIEPVREGKEVVGYRQVMTDEGVQDKRLCVIEPEFASLLRVAERDGNVVSALLRQAWDGAPTLKMMIKNAAEEATDAHISLIGHITADELRRYLTRTELGNGFMNRFCILAVRRSKCLPDGGEFPESLESLKAQFREVFRFAATVDIMRRTPDAATLWAEVYPELTQGSPGLLGAVTSRAEAHCLRLSMLYALLDKSSVIDVPHLQAALALWEYAEQSARFVFGQALGDPMADEILEAVLAAPDGLDRTDLHKRFSGHKKAAELERRLAMLDAQGFVKHSVEKTGGASRHVYRAVRPTAA